MDSLICNIFNRITIEEELKTNKGLSQKNQRTSSKPSGPGNSTEKCSLHLGNRWMHGRLGMNSQRSARTNALVVLRDTRWEDSRQIIATMEVDLSAGTQLVYTFPNMILSVNDFHNHVEVAIQTHGYDTWQGGESNLLITMALTGMLSNSSYMGFQYSMENVMDHLTTTGITAIPGERRSIEELEGMSWHLKPLPKCPFF
ncbi:hypothetical protein Tco_1340390 [Tanacetum coccineum]